MDCLENVSSTATVTEVLESAGCLEAPAWMLVDWHDDVRVAAAARAGVPCAVGESLCDLLVEDYPAVEALLQALRCGEDGVCRITLGGCVWYAFTAWYLSSGCLLLVKAPVATAYPSPFALIQPPRAAGCACGETDAAKAYFLPLEELCLPQGSPAPWRTVWHCVRPQSAVTCLPQSDMAREILFSHLSALSCLAGVALPADADAFALSERCPDGGVTANDPNMGCCAAMVLMLLSTLARRGVTSWRVELEPSADGNLFLFDAAWHRTKEELPPELCACGELAERNGLPFAWRTKGRRFWGYFGTARKELSLLGIKDKPLFDRTDLWI